MNLKNKVIILFLLLLLSHCSTLQNYIENRALDFTDIITIGGEVKTVGGSAWIWCFGGGVQFGQEGEGWGARNGWTTA